MKKKVVIVIIVICVLMLLVSVLGKDWANLARKFLHELVRAIF